MEFLFLFSFKADSHSVIELDDHQRTSEKLDEHGCKPRAKLAPFVWGWQPPWRTRENCWATQRCHQNLAANFPRSLQTSDSIPFSSQRQSTKSHPEIFSENKSWFPFSQEKPKTKNQNLKNQKSKIGASLRVVICEYWGTNPQGSVQSELSWKGKIWLRYNSWWIGWEAWHLVCHASPPFQGEGRKSRIHPMV